MAKDTRPFISDEELWNDGVDYLRYKYKDYQLTPTQIDKAIDFGESLYFLYRYKGKHFTPEHIDKALDKGKQFLALFKYAGANFNFANINKGISIVNEKCLLDYYRYLDPYMTDEQRQTIKDKREYEQRDNTPEGWLENRNLKPMPEKPLTLQDDFLARLERSLLEKSCGV